jgi:hypothetical protein
MSTVLVFVVIPAAIVLVIAALARTGSDRSRPTRRYRPGRPYDFAPIWFLASPEQVGPALGERASEHTRQAPAIESGIIEDSAGRRVLPGPVGGASDRW